MAHDKCRETLPAARAIRARPDHRRRHDLLVHRGIDAGVTTGAYRAVEFIKANIKLEAWKNFRRDSKSVEICTKYAQKGMLNIFIAVFFATLAFSFLEPFFFIGYLMSIAISGLYQPSSWPMPAAPGTTPRKS